MLAPDTVVGPGYGLWPGAVPGVYSWPGMVPGITLAPEGFFPGAVGAAQSAPVGIGQLSVVSGSLTPDASVAGSLGLDSAGSVSLTAAAPRSLGLPPA